MKAKDVSIESYINRKPVKRKNSYGLYISPFRDERKPKFLKLTMIKTYGTITELAKVVQL